MFDSMADAFDRPVAHVAGAFMGLSGILTGSGAMVVGAIAAVSTESVGAVLVVVCGAISTLYAIYNATKDKYANERIRRAEERADDAERRADGYYEQLVHLKHEVVELRVLRDHCEAHHVDRPPPTHA